MGNIKMAANSCEIYLHHKFHFKVINKLQYQQMHRLHHFKHKEKYHGQYIGCRG